MAKKKQHRKAQARALREFAIVMIEKNPGLWHNDAAFHMAMKAAFWTADAIEIRLKRKGGTE